MIQIKFTENCCGITMELPHRDRLNTENQFKKVVITYQFRIRMDVNRCSQVCFFSYQGARSGIGYGREGCCIMHEHYSHTICVVLCLVAYYFNGLFIAWVFYYMQDRFHNLKYKHTMPSGKDFGCFFSIDSTKIVMTVL